MENKYNIGDIVFVDKVFDNTTYGAWVSVEKFKAVVEKIEKTPTFGWGYLLSRNGEKLPVWYWESDILDIVHPDDEIYWKIWGTI